ncbi:MerR family transcriptional regulator [Planococcus sp. N028]|uniref:MerR family transcriptional regulator n=1 Tax=Planococcus shixiaomingii TaxID=3058393 RepID=A0ABT8N2J0_9BACL|nr:MULTISPECIES: MerR family transcriptional regulator [unclassified Planococcus (in: firmicutes)]MDN7242103.1 MerR family transcriptional regulator [Planococcus sp. N028]WKA54377.1 MerR family transcriptional regulator [Planococcus sp. N022]
MYNIKAAAKILDMPKVTIRSWETRYEAITPARTESGHRLYSDQNLEDLKWLKIQVQERGMKISQAVQQLHLSRKKFHSPPADVTGHNDQPYDKQIQELYSAAAEMDTERFNYLLDLNFSLFHYRTVFFSIIVPLMVRIGDEWEKGTMTVAHEHLISHIVQQRFNQFFRVFPTSPDLPKTLALCPSGEHHQLGLLLFTLFLRENGFPVAYIGPDTPLEGLSDLIDKQNFKLLCISISNEKMQPVMESYIDTLAEANPEMRFIVGGRTLAEPKIDGNVANLGGSYEFWQEWLQQQPL